MDEVKRAAEFNFDARSLASTLEGTKSTRQEGLFPCRAVSSQFPSYLWQLEATPLALLRRFAPSTFLVSAASAAFNVARGRRRNQRAPVPPSLSAGADLVVIPGKIPFH